MQYNTYFTDIVNTIGYLYMRNAERGTCYTEIGSMTAIVIDDADVTNELKFYFDDGIIISERLIAVEMCRKIAYEARGSVRKLIENPAVLLLMKEFGLNEIYHVSQIDDNRSRGTLWTPNDAEALLK